MSSRPLFGHSTTVAAFVANRIGVDGFGECQAIGFLDAAGVLEAGFVYHNWNPDADVIEISGASLHRGWASRSRLRLIFAYPFEQLGAQLVVARHSERNLVARRIWRRIGASEFLIPRLRGRDEAECIATLTAEAWQQYEDRHGKRFGAEAA